MRSVTDGDLVVKRFQKIMKSNDKIKGIIFDLGGVIVEAGFEFEFYKYVSDKFGVDEHKLQQISQMEWSNLEKGRETNQQFWQKVTKKLSIGLDAGQELAELWVEFYKRYARKKEDTISLIEKLHKNYKLGIISNTQPEHIEINRGQDLFKYFDIILLSYELGVRKPEREIFELASKKLQIPLANLLFVDDNVRWVGAARRHGLKAILFKSADQLEKSLRRLGVI